MDRELRSTLLNALDGEFCGEFESPILWFYDPLAVVPFAGQMGERVIVYDCMDELAQFKDPPEYLIERELELLRRADVVFCGGKKMREKRIGVNSNTHFFGTGVDCIHFGKALSTALPIPPDIARLQGPILGYFGVVDERIDYDLLAKLADARKDWHVVMVGPSAKVDPNHFPRRTNLHWLGGRPYAELPALTKGFSVCLMPFAINASTEYINPTKALEYMATGRPVVSTAINEVKSNFASVAHIAASHEQFISLCLKEATKPSLSAVERGLALAAENTWEAILDKMETHIAGAISVRNSLQEKKSINATFPITGAAYV